MIAGAEEFRDHIKDAGYIIDREGVHHKFADGMHGRKIDFDNIPTTSELFKQWVEITAQYLSFLYGASHVGKLALLSVANGTNRLVGPVAETLGGKTLALLTEKDSPKSVVITLESREVIQRQRPHTVVALDDVGTTGGTAATAIMGARELGVEYTDAMFTWQRRKFLEKLQAIHAEYHSVIYDYKTVPTYRADACQHCADGWQLKEH